MIGIFALLLLMGCGDSSNEIHCDNILPPDQSKFSTLVPLITGGTQKGCARCHNGATPVYGYNFEGPAISYDAFVTKMDRIYPQLASGKMPESGQRWSETDLRLLRSWYCNGAFYE